VETRSRPGVRPSLFPPLPLRRLCRAALPLAALALGTCEPDKPVAPPAPAPVAAVEAAPRTAILARGRAMQFSARLRDADGRILTERAVTWSSDNERVATVSASGQVGGVAPGRATITATSDGVTGVSGQDEDLLAFTPTSLGPTTAGTWAMYFDGCDVGLSSSSDEDVDAVAVDATGKIYLSTIGNFSVTGRSGADEDVFVFTPTSLGGTTAGTYSSTLFFDGSVYGVTGDIFGIDLP